MTPPVVEIVQMVPRTKQIRAAAASLSDDALFAAIVPKMRACRGASYADVAAEAIAVGRRGLATRLLEREAQPAKQVWPD